MEATLATEPSTRRAWVDPLSFWRSEEALYPPSSESIDQAEARKQLRRLARYLALHARRNPLPPFADDPLRSHDYNALALGELPPPVRLPPEELRQAEALASCLQAPGAADEPFAEPWLLHLIGFAVDPSSIPFWTRTLENASEHGHGPLRRTFALAALSYLFGRQTEERAVDALRAATHHRNAHVRSSAAIYLLAAYRLAGQAAPLPAVSELDRLARTDSSLAVRVTARQLLAVDRLPLPLELLEGGYTFEAIAKAPTQKVPERVRICVRAVQTLGHLDVVLRRAFPAVQGKAEFFVAGEGADGRPLAGFHQGQRSPGEVLLGALGLQVGDQLACQRTQETQPCTIALRVAETHEQLASGLVLPAIEGNTIAAPPVALLVMKTQVNGTKFHRAPELCEVLQPGDWLRLRREPDNPHDPNAIEVLTADEEKLGYIPRDRNEALARLLDAGDVCAAKLAEVEGPAHAPYLLVHVFARCR